MLVARLIAGVGGPGSLGHQGQSMSSLIALLFFLMSRHICLCFKNYFYCFIGAFLGPLSHAVNMAKNILSKSGFQPYVA